MTDPTYIETFFADRMLTRIPLEQVLRIYRVGRPWPLISNELERLAEQDAEAMGVSVGTAGHALDQLYRFDAESWKEMTEIATKALDQGNLEHAIFDVMVEHPWARRMIDYSQHVAQLIGESPLIVLDLYIRILEYAELHPDWDTEQTGTA